MVQFQCSDCGTVFRVGRERLAEGGQIATCAVCDHRFLVRLPSDVTGDIPLAADVAVQEPVFAESSASGDELYLETEQGEVEIDDTLTRAEALEPPVAVEAEPGEAEKTIRRIPSDVEMPEPAPSGAEEALMTRRRWRDPLRAELKKSVPIFSPGAETSKPTTGFLYKLIILLIGFASLPTAFLDLGPWRVDPAWSVTLIAIGLFSFWMQSLSGLLVAGLFGFFYPLAVFSHQVQAIANGELTGVLMIGAQTGLAVIILVIYGVLMARQKALFALKEGSGQSILAFLFGLLTLGVVIWARLDSTLIPPLVRFVPTEEFYVVVPALALLQAWALSLAVALGFSARTVRNRMLMLANTGMVLGFLALILLYVEMVLGNRIPIFFF